VLDLSQYREKAAWYHINVERDKIEPCHKCPICGKPAVKRVVDVGVYAADPMFVFMHEFLVSVSDAPIGCIGITACQVR